MKRSIRNMKWIIAGLLMAAGVAMPAAAQENSRTEFFVGYSNLLNQRVTNSDVGTVNGLSPAQVKSILGADITPNQGKAGMNGGTASVTFYITDRFGLTGDFSGSLDTEPAMFFGRPGSSKTRVYQFLGGPRFTFPTRSLVTPFVHALFGAARLEGTYKNDRGTVIDKHTPFAMALGGGLDVRISRRINARVLQIDYNPAFQRERQFVDSAQVPYTMNGLRRDNVRFSFGVVIR